MAGTQKIWVYVDELADLSDPGIYVRSRRRTVGTEGKTRPLLSEETLGKASTQAPPTRPSSQTRHGNALAKQDQPALPRSTRSHIYLIHRWDLVPFVLCGVIHIHLRRIVPVGGRTGGNVSEPGGSIPGCDGHTGPSPVRTFLMPSGSPEAKETPALVCRGHFRPRHQLAWDLRPEPDSASQT